MTDERRRLAVFVAVAATVVAASLLPGPTGPGGEPTGDVAPPGTDLVVHAVGYAAVAFTMARALPPRLRRRDAVGPLAGVIVVAAALGTGVELAQGVVPGRDPSVLDAVANAVGAVVGTLWWRRRDRGE
ncbi:VanZ family protein [Halobaculum lipolyticum]|uniref:VanZ family protein n=1 Tax=Halobaculum lipolyticum TaxID=3032001 RepID=A0ABD5WAT2_9EURY|nr:VanZ family protein [Halobaculum sp. DT31]